MKNRTRTPLSGIRISILLLTLVLVVSMMPFFAFAEETSSGESYTDDELTGEDTDYEDTDYCELITDFSLPDSDSLIEKYIEEKSGVEINDSTADNQASGDLVSKKARFSARREVLNEYEQKLYDALKTGVAKIAAGQTNKSIVDVTMTSEEFEKCDYSLVINALLTDCPYELYWCDKTTGALSAFNRNTNTVHIYFSVSADYRTGEIQEQKTYIDQEGVRNIFNVYYTDLNKTSAASRTVTNAKRIVAENASLDDVTKLRKYKDEVCRLADYDTSVSDGREYGDPWQLIYVFDDNTATNVVCEGYAKAFQFLCNLSSFKNDSVECHTMTGYLDENPHMWNVLHMDDAKSYLADITNCDDGTSGAPDQLFLKGYYSMPYDNVFIYRVSKTFANGRTEYKSMAYQYDSDAFELYNNLDMLMSDSDYNSASAKVSHFHEVPATCTNAGSIEFWIREGKFYRDSYCTDEISEAGTAVKALGHQLTNHARVDSTTTATGTEAYWECTRCHKLFSDGAGANEISAPAVIPKKKVSLGVKSLWASQHDKGRVLFKWTRKEGAKVTGWNLRYRFRKIGGNNTWSGWTTKSYPASADNAWIPVTTDHVIEIHAQAKGDNTWSTGIITCPAGGKYHAMKTAHVINIATGHRLAEKKVGSSLVCHTQITLKTGGSIKVKPDYDYDPSIKDFKIRPKLYPNHMLYDIGDKSLITITKPDGSKYNGGIIDGTATIKATKAGKTTIIFRSPNGRTMIADVTITN